MIAFATFALLILGTAAVAVAATLTLSDDPPGDTRPIDTPSSSAPTLAPERPDGSASGAFDSGLAGLADPAWIARTATATAIPERALAAYAGAALSAEQDNPGCGLGWNTLAAIGLVESEHGTIGDATIDTTGSVTPPIIGVPLNGDGVARVPDTDRGELDGDTTWDRAVGPMQLTPGTWAAHAADGNDDGAADIQHIDDAAVTAAAYLCSTGGDLNRPDPWIRAIAAYNAGIDYNHKVAEAADAYAAADVR